MIATFEAEKKVAIAAAKVEATREGEQRGELIGQIIVLSRVFQVAAPPRDELLGLPIERLTKILDELSRQIPQ